MTRARDLADSADKDITGTLTVDAVSSGSVTASGDVIRNDTTTGTSKFALQYSGSDAAVFKRNNSTGVATIANGYAGAPVDAINISLTGNVGIGTASPTASLTVGAANNEGTLRIGDSGTYYGEIKRINASDELRIGHYGASQKLTFHTVNTERMRIASSGNVGIGTSSPSEVLEVYGTLPIIQINDRGLYQAQIGLIGNDTEFRGSSGNIEFYSGSADGASSTERMRIDSSGGLRINTASVFASGAEKLTILGDSNNQYDACLVMKSGYASGAQAINGVYFLNSSGNTAGYISWNGTSTSYVTSSDYRLKTAVEYDWDATTRLKQLKPARFAWIADGDDAVPVDGFLAHEVQDIVPEAISGTKDGMRDEEYQVSAATGDIYTPAVEATYDDDGVELTAAVDEVIHSADVERPEELAEGQQWRETTAAVMGTRSVPDYQGIDQSKLTPLLTKALIEAVEKIEQLEARITALEAN